MSEHGKRRSWRRFIRENAYRDFWLFAITVVLVLIAVRAFDASSQAAREARKTDAALCAFLRDLQQRVDSGNAFLAKHPHGIPGISAGVIRTSIAGQQRTVSSLRGLGCRRTLRR